MNITVSASRSLHGVIEKEIPGDKSISHRAALFAALADGQSRIRRFQVSGVTRPLLNALSALGVEWDLQGDFLTVRGKGLHGLQAPASPIDCGNSATTLRLLTGALAAAGLPAVLEGTPGLCSRPMDRILSPLKEMGVKIKSSPECTAPLILEGRPSDSFLHSLEVVLPVASAQVKSCLLLAALGSQGMSRIEEPGPSRDHSERMLCSMGVELHSKTKAGRPVIEIYPPVPLVLRPVDLTIPGDPSAAAFLIVTALLVPDSEIEIHHICLNSTRTGLIDVLKEMGGEITITAEYLEGDEPCGDLLVRSSHLHGTAIGGDQVVRMIDEFPIFAVAAAAADGVSTVHDAAELRLKESDRISVLAEEFRTLGVAITEFKDGFSIQGGKIDGGRVTAHGDHRLAMALTVAGLVSGNGVCVQGIECSAESFPGFVEVLRHLGAAIEEES